MIVRVDEIKWYDEKSGVVRYEVELNGNYLYARQPFDTNGNHRNENNENVWKMEQKEPLTLSPSFGADWGNGCKIHLFFKNGKIEILNDSTPQPIEVIK